MRVFDEIGPSIGGESPMVESLELRRKMKSSCIAIKSAAHASLKMPINWESVLFWTRAKDT